MEAHMRTDLHTYRRKRHRESLGAGEPTATRAHVELQMRKRRETQQREDATAHGADPTAQAAADLVHVN